MTADDPRFPIQRPSANPFPRPPGNPFMVKREPAESAADKIRRLQAEAAQLAGEDLDDFIGAMAILLARMEEIAGSEAHPAAVRQQIRNMAERYGQDHQALQSLKART